MHAQEGEEETGPRRRWDTRDMLTGNNDLVDTTVDVDETYSATPDPDIGATYPTHNTSTHTSCSLLRH